MQIPLIKGDRQSKLDYRENLPVNFTSVISQIKGSEGYLLSHDGLTEYAQTGGEARGGVFNDRFNKHFRVSGNSFECINTDGTVDTLGVIPGSSPCSFARSFNSQSILSDGKWYLWDGATFNQVLDPELGVPIDHDWFLGIYVFTDGQSVFHSDVANERSISPLKYTSSEYAPDPIIGVSRSGHQQIAAFNRYSTEYFYFNAAASVGTSVLQVIQNKTVRAGIIGTNCKTLLDDLFFILGGRIDESPSFHVINGTSIESFSTREIDKIISGYSESELKGVVLETRVVDRDKFIIAHLPCETLLYNHTVSVSLGPKYAWTVIKTGVDIDEPWRGKFGVFDPRISKWIYGDIKENKLAYLDSQIASQYGQDVEAILYTPIVPVKQSSIDNFEIETIPGYSSTDVTCSFSMSYDGVTYGQEYFNAISTPDRYNSRYIARRLGFIDNYFNFKFRIVSKDKVAFSSLKVNEL